MHHRRRTLNEEANMKSAGTGLFILAAVLISFPVRAEKGADAYKLSEVVSYGLKNNPSIRSAKTDVDIETYGIRSAKADRMPRLDLTGGATRYRYPTAVTPLYGTPPSNFVFPEFDTTIYDAGVSFTMPLYRGGRLDRGVTVAELRKSVAEDLLSMNRQELVYNLTSSFYKTLQLEKLLGANRETVKQLEAHRKNVELFYRAGTAPKVDLLKTETELAHANQAALISRNNVESSYELLKTLMGVDDMSRGITLEEAPVTDEKYPPLDESLSQAFKKRPDYRASAVRLRIAEEQVDIARGRRLPSLNLTSDYSERSGTDLEFEENWTAGLRLTVPLFDGGSISSDVGKAKAGVLQAKEEERALRLEITRSVRDAYLGIENAAERIAATEKAVASAKESLRIEQLRYKTGAGTSTDVIDAQEALLRAEMDYYQALYDKAIAHAALRKATGEEVGEEARK
jgi:outer membrane protein